MVELKTKDLILDKGKSREIVIAENIDLVRLLDLSADFGDKRNAKMTPIFKLREKSNTGIQKSDSNVCVFQTYFL